MYVYKRDARPTHKYLFTGPRSLDLGSLAPLLLPHSFLLLPLSLLPLLLQLLLAPDVLLGENARDTRRPNQGKDDWHEDQAHLVEKGGKEGI